MAAVSPGSPRRRRHRGLWVLAGIGAVLVLCVGVGVIRFALPYAFVQHKDDLPASTAGLAAVCEKGGTAFGSAPAFGGPAPHPMEVATGRKGQSIDLLDAGGVAGPTGGAAWDPLTPAQVQLVACAIETGTGDVVGQCKYSSFGLPGEGGFPIPLRSTIYRITVYETRTHRQVTSASDVVAADTSCPPTVRRSVNDKDDVYTTLSAGQIRQLFARYLG